MNMRNKEVDSPSTDHPRITIIIPTRNEADSIERCLRSVLSMVSIADGVEIFIIDGMSTDGTKEMISRWAVAHSIIKVYENQAQIVPAALNLGIQKARGDWIVRLDAHCEYDSNYLVNCLRAAQQSGADNVGGYIESSASSAVFQQKIIRGITTHRFGVGASPFRLGGAAGWVDTVPFGCYRRAVFVQIGLYDERLQRNQDYEFNQRLIKAGGKIWFDPSIRAKYFNQKKIKGLLRQAFTTGQWNVWTWRIAPHAFARRHLIPALFVVACIACALSMIVSRSIALFALSALLSAYFSVACIAAIQQSVRLRDAGLLCLPLLFFIYHVAYGLGEVAGALALLFGSAPVCDHKRPDVSRETEQPEISLVP